MDDASIVSWSRLARWRQECAESHGRAYELPLGDPSRTLHQMLAPNTRLLDIGAGVAKPVAQMLRESTQDYKSMDSDPAGDFDYRSFSDVPEGAVFDIVIANQCLEHLSFEECVGIVRSAHRHLVPGGSFIATVPNAAHPVRQWADVTHRTAWPAFDLYGLFRESDFHTVRLSRYNKHPRPRNPLKRLVVDIVCEVFRMDWCDSLMIVGTK